MSNIILAGTCIILLAFLLACLSEVSELRRWKRNRLEVEEKQREEFYQGIKESCKKIDEQIIEQQEYYNRLDGIDLGKSIEEIKEEIAHRGN